ncbi:sugar porter family MFS transporter [Nakamurella endophytica]|uniref:Metabolite transport protein CsbC n=1 Tax=Nakamurella endophytica TaxID=1748367 RepID=A0A917SPY2_9ACTN|nr:sugar porter family MFS transporter [Nakamurella endophytica]GGL89321.1 putative metabolite transport protein CsbC [Nakamurella endophytica]
MPTSFVKEAVKGNNKFLLRIAVIAALGGFLFGYDTGIISGAQLYIQRDLSTTSLEQQWIVGALLVGAVVGAALSGWLSDRIGRRWTKVGSGTVYVLAGLASAFSPDTPWLLASRFVLGLAVGTASFVSVEYISEQAPARLRGGVTSFNQLMVTTGILVAYLVAAALQGAPAGWRWMLGLSAVPGLALAVGMLTVPSSPRWLVARGRKDDARRVLSRTRSDDETDDELDSITEAVGTSRSTRLRDLFRQPLRPLMVVGLVLAIGQQVIGVNTVVYYSATILNYTGLSASASVLQAISVGITNVVFTVVAILLLDRVGRRPLLLVGTTAATLALVALGLWFAVPGLKDHPLFALVFLLVFMAGFAVGLGPVFWLMISEIFPVGVRSKAMSIATVANWAANFLVSYFFLQLVGAMGESGTFWLYAGFGVLSFFFFLRKVPETKDRSLEEIQQEVGSRT